MGSGKGALAPPFSAAGCSPIPTFQSAHYRTFTPLGTVSTHGQGALVSGSVKVLSDGPIGGMLRYDLPHIGVAVVEASSPISDAIFPVHRQEGGITTGVAVHNLESSPGLVRCDLLQEGVLRDAVSIPLEANGQTSCLIDQAFPGTDTSRLRGVGALRCGRGGAVQRRGPGNGPRHPHLHDPAGLSDSTEDAPGIVARCPCLV